MSKLLLLLLLLTISHLTQNIPTVSGHQVFLVDTAIRPLISLRRILFVPAPETKVLNTTMAVGMLAALGALADQQQGAKSRTGRSAVRSGESSGESSGCATPKTPTDWNYPTSPRSTDEVLYQAISHLHRNSEYTRGYSPEQDDLNEYRTLDPSRCGSPTNEDDILTAGEGQAPFRGRKYQEESCVCTGVEGPNGVFTNTRSRSSSRAPEAQRDEEG